MNRLFFCLSLLLPLLVWRQLRAQDSTFLSRFEFYRMKSHDLILGYHELAGDEDKFTGRPFRMVEVGYARSFISHGGHHGPSAAVLSLTQGVAYNREFLTVTRLGASVRGWMFSLGLFFSYYTDFKYGNLKACPEMGLGFTHFKAVFGFNLPTIYNRDFEAVRYGLYHLSIAANISVARKRVDFE